MAQSVVRGWIDNRARGRVTGEIVLLGRDDAVRLDLEGDANPDVAGCRIEFMNPKPVEGDPTDLFPKQDGVPGDITCSRKCRVPDVPIEEFVRHRGDPLPTHWANTLYVEWFSERNGRVVIETADFTVTISEHAWTMTEEEALRHAEAVQEAMLGWMDRLQGAVDGDDGDDGGDEEEGEAPDEPPMDEFAWEKFLKESDRRGEKYGELIEKYRDHPDRERLVAREMGWEHIEDLLDADQRGLIPSPEEMDDDADLNGPEPDPAREGIDWVRDEDGDITHPLSLRARKLAMRLWHTCEAHGLVEGGLEPDPNRPRYEDVEGFVFNAQALGAKLAGALCSLADGLSPGGGFVVAYLKRAMRFLNDALAAEEKVRAAARLPVELLDGFRGELFTIRNEMLVLMERFRGET
ncbi:MAG: hypothetical protein FJ221_09095 [Lentisphaerae bacterium]|nr:hypothetical protein [Lentisphaerota bacterium]